jgi:ribonuclease HII
MIPKNDKMGALVMTKKEETELRRLAKLEAERDRIEMMKEFEYRYAEYSFICGIDEVGRGPFAGPVVAAAVILPKNEEILYLNDSKKLSEKKREELYDVIMEKAVAVGLGSESNEVIDEINIKKATHSAMRKAIADLKDPRTGEKVVPDILLVDAEHIPDTDIKQIAIIKGDAKSISIAAASIIAKVTRDRLMTEMDKVYPGYDFAGNKGYGTAAHIAAIKELGMTPIHRRSFVHI